jgi:hypothetical protein
MKKLNYIYFLVPVLLLASFVVYWFYNTQKDKSNSSASTTSSSSASPASTDKTETDSTATTITTPVNTKSAIEKADWGKNVKITFFDDVFQYQYSSNGLPNHSLADAYLIPKDVASQPFKDDPVSSFDTKKSDYIKETTIDTKITYNPKYSSTVTNTPLGRIGVTLSGAALYNDYENMERTVVALDDNVTHDHASFVDDCNGHSLQDGSSYHYHGVPKCISTVVDKAGQHSALIGVLQDGFPVYGSKDTGGVAITNEKLDECGGHFGITPEFPQGVYHYHLTEDKAPYSIDCYHGEITVSDTQMPPQNGNNAGGMQQPDLAKAAATLGVTESALKEALGDSRPPDFDAAAKKMGITTDKLRSAIGTPPMR